MLYRVGGELSTCHTNGEERLPVSFVGIVDGGAQVCCMGSSFYSQHSVSLGPLQKTTKMCQLADDRAHRFEGYLNAWVDTSGVSVSVRIYVMPGRREVLLGKPWLFATKAIQIHPFDWLFATPFHGSPPFVFLPNVANPPPAAVDPIQALNVLASLGRRLRATTGEIQLNDVEVLAVESASTLPTQHHDHWPDLVEAADAQDWLEPAHPAPAPMPQDEAAAPRPELSEERRRRREEWQPHYPFGGPELTEERANEVVQKIRWGDALTVEQRERLEKLVRAKQHVFGLSVKDLASSKKVVFDVDVDPALRCPTKARQPNLAQDQREWLNDYLDKMLSWNVIRRITPEEVAWVSTIQLVPKAKAHYREQTLELSQDLANDGLKRAGLPYDASRPSPPPEFSPEWIPAAGHRLVHDYRPLNKVTRNITEYPFGGMEAKVASLAGSKIYGTVDMLMGYFVIPATERAQRYLCFYSDRYGYLTYTRMPFGPEEAPARFNHFATGVFGDLEGATDGAKIVRWMDDINIAAETFEEFYDALEKILERCEDSGASLSAQKTSLGATSVKWCGNVISKDGVESDPSKVASIVQWPRPKTALDVLQFVSTASFLRGHIPNFSSIAAPLIALTNLVDLPKAMLGKKGVRKSALRRTQVEWKFQGTPEQSFALLKAAVAFAVRARGPDFKGIWYVETFINSISFGARLLQADERGYRHLVTAASRLRSAAEKSSDPIITELRAIRFALDKFDSYVRAGRVVVIVDCLALRDILAGKLSDTHLRWREALFAYNIIKYEHRKPRSQAAIEARKAGPSDVGELEQEHGEEQQEAETWEEAAGLGKGESWAESIPRAGGEKGSAVDAYATGEALRILQTYRTDREDLSPAVDSVDVKTLQLADDYEALLERFAGDPLEKVVLFMTTTELEETGAAAATIKRQAACLFIKDGRLYYQPASGAPTLKAITVAEGEALALKIHEEEGHFGRELVLQRARKNGFYWVNQRSSIEKIVMACATCQQWGPAQKAALLGPIILPQPFDLMAMDFVRVLDSKEYVLVFAEYLSRHCWGAVGPPTAQTVVDALRKLCTVAMAPIRLLCDNGSHFANALVRETCKQLNIALHFVAVYAPWSNGLIERNNGLLVTQLRKLCKEQPNTPWPTLVDVGLRNINRRVLPSLGFTPQELLYGVVEWGTYAPRREDYAIEVADEPDPNVVEVRQTLVDVLREEVTSSREKQIKAIPEGGKVKEFKAGDLVMVKRQDVKGKLEPRWRGPVAIAEVLPNSTTLVSLDGVHEKRRHHFTNLKKFHARPDLNDGTVQASVEE